MSSLLREGEEVFVRSPDDGKMYFGVVVEVDETIGLCQVIT